MPDVLELLRNSHESLRELNLPKFIFPQSLNFLNLTKVTLNFGGVCDEVFFKLQFQNLLDFAPNIKLIETDLTKRNFYLSEDITRILDFLGNTLIWKTLCHLYWMAWG